MQKGLMEKVEKLEIYVGVTPASDGEECILNRIKRIEDRIEHLEFAIFGNPNNDTEFFLNKLKD